VAREDKLAEVCIEVELFLLEGLLSLPKSTGKKTAI